MLVHMYIDLYLIWLASVLLPIIIQHSLILFYLKKMAEIYDIESLCEVK